MCLWGLMLVAGEGGGDGLVGSDGGRGFDMT